VRSIGSPFDNCEINGIPGIPEIPGIKEFLRIPK
jgi:hypothetical protein